MKRILALLSAVTLAGCIMVAATVAANAQFAPSPTTLSGNTTQTISLGKPSGASASLYSGWSAATLTWTTGTDNCTNAGTGAVEQQQVLFKGGSVSSATVAKTVSATASSANIRFESDPIDDFESAPFTATWSVKTICIMGDGSTVWSSTSASDTLKMSSSGTQASSDIAGDYFSPDGLYRLSFQPHDGNIAVYRLTASTAWSKTGGTAVYNLNSGANFDGSSCPQCKYDGPFTFQLAANNGRLIERDSATGTAIDNWASLGAATNYWSLRVGTSGAWGPYDGTSTSRSYTPGACPTLTTTSKTTNCL